MCGIAGRMNGISNGPKRAALASEVDAMLQSLVHRGPDGFGTWCDDDAGVCIGHRRLAIVDLSPHGRQPMESSCGRYVVTFNGEIYNHKAMRARLEREGNYDFGRGQSDTAVMLGAFSTWGVAKAVSSFVGMFAFGLWDRVERKLTLVRDRIGEKPLYFGVVDKEFVFASELKAISALPGFAGRIDRSALALYLRHGYVPSPYSIYEGIQKLPAGCMLEIRADDFAGNIASEPRRYWSVPSFAHADMPISCGSDGVEATKSLDALLHSTIRDQMVADVKVGAFLSGGIDSSTVVGIMQAECSRRVSSFSIGFEESGFNEAAYANRVASHLGTDHTELYISDRDALDVVPGLAAMYDEPFADSSQIPTFLVARLARAHVTVALSGDGGDELFCGYRRHAAAERLLGTMMRFPSFGRRMAGWLLKTAVHLADPGFVGANETLMRLDRFGRVLSANHPECSYREMVSAWHSNVLIGESADQTMPPGWGPESNRTLRRRLLLKDLLTYLPDDILVKVDRATMAVSLESRTPLLDHRIVEFAFSLPDDLLVREGVSKWVLRQVLYRYVPRELIERPKQGFGIPLAEWLRGPLRDWAETLLDPALLRSDGLINVTAVRARWHAHLSGRADWSTSLWIVLMLQEWKHRRASVGQRVIRSAA
jgi:asparagine synthase (glutamine-hydrolysing)